MLISRATVLVVATLSALFAGGSLLALAKGPPSGPEAIPRAADGHFWAEGVASSDTGRARIRFLVDTGASSVALTASDAERLGLHPDRLIYTHPVLTAEGQASAALVMLSRLTVGGVELRDVKALVLKPDPSQAAPHASLLGMSYLGRLSKMTATRDGLILER
jgi:aspartyl protease family protein